MKTGDSEVGHFFNLPGDSVKPDAARSETWNRGRYLTDALAHCGECHTPCNLMMGMRQDAYLQGALLDGIVAPDITKAGLTQMGFDPLVLSAFMKSGISNQGAMANQMFEVVHFSTQYMSHDDLNAPSAYLFENSSSSRQDAPVRYRLIRAACRSDLPRERFRPMALRRPSARQPEGPFTEGAADPFCSRRVRLSMTRLRHRQPNLL
jgi:mono/diheme cytochrome c family protein